MHICNDNDWKVQAFKNEKEWKAILIKSEKEPEHAVLSKFFPA